MTRCLEHHSSGNTLGIFVWSSFCPYPRHFVASDFNIFQWWHDRTKLPCTNSKCRQSTLPWIGSCARGGHGSAKLKLWMSKCILSIHHSPVDLRLFLLNFFWKWTSLSQWDNMILTYFNSMPLLGQSTAGQRTKRQWHCAMYAGMLAMASSMDLLMSPSVQWKRHTLVNYILYTKY